MTKLYIVRFLHQTTTEYGKHTRRPQLYIVRFLHQTTTAKCFGMFSACCISSVSYIKPQRYVAWPFFYHVVYRPFPTSNHNICCFLSSRSMLYIVRFLHQTTTSNSVRNKTKSLYIVRFLHQTTTSTRSANDSDPLYIVRFLHQTTTAELLEPVLIGCISSVSYIKPQLMFKLVQRWHGCISSVSYIKPQRFILSRCP